MAFATANVKASSAGDLWRLVGDWTSAAGDTTGTVTVGGVRLYQTNFEEQDNTTGDNRRLDFSTSVSGANTTVTVSLSGRSAATGRFSIEYR